jgi:hypothetical protein
MGEGLDKNGMFGRIADLEIPPLEYYKLVGDFNRLIQTELIKKFSENTELLGDIVTLVTPGSDARLEKGSFMSPLEVIALVKEDIDLDLYKENLIKTITEISSTTKLAKVFEIKGPNTSLTTVAPHRYQPGRIADSRFIYGSEESAQNAKVKLGEEILNLKAHDVDHIFGLKRDARKATESGKNRIGGVDAIHFDLNTGTIFYNPEAHQLSFKIGPLRLVQNSLLVEEIKHTRHEHDKNFISTLDANIVNRLNQLSNEKRVNLERNSIEEIGEHYAFFLRLYHKSEIAYEKNKQIALQLNQTEIEEVSKRLKALSELMTNFKLK